MSGRQAVERAIAALRTGRAVRIEGPEPLTFVSIETATPEMLALVDPDATAPLLLSGRRAAALSLANEREAADPDQPVLIAREAWLDASAALTLADPARAKSCAGSASVLPLSDMPETQILAFRGSDDGQDHVALLVGAFGGKPPLLRLHSECLTGDVFGSLKCDCGPQLKEALRLIGTAGGGVLLYLRQEGRGIGLANKLRAYALQDRGLDTVDANLRLGFADDERDYAHAAAILRALGIDEVRLLTNNLSKVEALEREGIKVVERVAHHMPSNPHNADYLAVKREKSGHLP